MKAHRLTLDQIYSHAESSAKQAQLYKITLNELAVYLKGLAVEANAVTGRSASEIPLIAAEIDALLREYMEGADYILNPEHPGCIAELLDYRHRG